MVLGYPQGLKKKHIPYEAQIIRVADEFDAIVSKRQYKSHTNISDALKIIIQNTKPAHFTALHGKTNPEIVRALIRVVLDDTAYEIFSLQMYISEIKQDIKRIKKAISYKHAGDKARSQKKKDYYYSGFKMCLIQTESYENIEQALHEYLEILHDRKKQLKFLRKEVRKIKKLRYTV